MDSIQSSSHALFCNPELSTNCAHLAVSSGVDVLAMCYCQAQKVRRPLTGIISVAGVYVLSDFQGFETNDVLCLLEVLCTE